MIDTGVFVETLRAKGSYETPQNVKQTLSDRVLGGTTFWYHWRVMQVILKGGRLARQGKWTRENWQDLSLDMWRGVEGCRGQLRAEGCNNLAALSSPSVIVANHMSLLETFTIPAIVLPFQHMTFVVKDSLLHVPLFRDVMAGVRPISVKRENPREDFKTLMETGPVVLGEGRSIVIFPQATRNTTFIPSQFNTLGAKLAKKAGVPLVPLALKTDFHGLGRFVRDFGPVDHRKPIHFSFGPGIDVTGNGRDAHEASIAFIADKFSSWGGAVDRTAT
jgi:1-acyl-sn-glycerol-3-phosphate acyltransferase